MSAAPPAIVGTGFDVPEQVRTNDDPIFDWLRKNTPPGAPLFTGYVERRVLGPGESVASIMVRAAAAAIKDAQVAVSDVDLLLGYASVSEYVTPNELAQVHRTIGLGPGVPVLPLGDDFTNFNSAVLVADAFIRAGCATTALIVCGDNWTQYADYHTPQSASVGDAAAAAIVAPARAPTEWTLVAHAHVTASDDYGEMYMGGNPPTAQITPAGLKAFGAFGMGQAPQLLSGLIERHGLAASDVSVIPHQASAVLIEHWGAQLPGVTFVHTMAEYGNVVLSAIPLTLAAKGAQITTDHLILFGLGMQLQASALLLSRQPS